jgi:hypothetical protein
MITSTSRDAASKESVEISIPSSDSERLNQ